MSIHSSCGRAEFIVLLLHWSWYRLRTAPKERVCSILFFGCCPLLFPSGGWCLWSGLCKSRLGEDCLILISLNIHDEFETKHLVGTSVPLRTTRNSWPWYPPAGSWTRSPNPIAKASATSIYGSIDSETGAFWWTSWPWRVRELSGVEFWWYIACVRQWWLQSSCLEPLSSCAATVQACYPHWTPRKYIWVRNYDLFIFLRLFWHGVVRQRAKRGRMQPPSPADDFIRIQNLRELFLLPRTKQVKQRAALEG